jgi:hypothetical protein
MWERVKTQLLGKSARLDEALVKVEQGDRAALETVTLRKGAMVRQELCCGDRSTSYRRASLNLT